MGRVTEKLRGIGLLGLFPLHAAITLLIHMQFVAALFHLFHLILYPCSALGKAKGMANPGQFLGLCFVQGTKGLHKNNLCSSQRLKISI